MKKQFVILLVLAFVLSPLSAGFTVNTAAAQTKSDLKLREDISRILPDRTQLGQIEIDKVKKQNLSEPKKKLGTDLLKLIDSSFLLPNQNRTQLISEMKELKQFVAKADSVKTIDKRVTNKAHNDLVYVYVSLNPTAQTSIIDSLVWKVTDRDEKNHLAVALVEVNKLEALASLSGVRSISSVLPPVTNSGSVVTEGDIIHQTDDVRSAYSQGGAGIKIGVISDGVDNIASSKSTGDLPAGVTVLSNSEGGDEGTAMLEIIYDMVPNASLYFHDSGNNILAFNSAINDLVDAGVNVIIDDILWFSEPYFEDGTIAENIASVLANNNIVYVSAAGNSGGAGYSVGHYQGDYYNNGSDYHDFSRGSSDFRNLYVVIPPGESVNVVLQWNDSFGFSGNDYDLVMDNSIEVLDQSINPQDGDDDPLEIISYTNETAIDIDARIWVNNYNGLAMAKTLELFILPSNGTWVYANNLTPVDSIFGHAAVPGVIAVGAIDANDPGNDTIESFSSQGPVTIIGQGQRAKPDITGIDNVSVTGVGGFGSPFPGTSAAAPHIAAIVAQLWAQYPSATGNQIRDQILNTAVDLGVAGTDTIFGYGRADALFAFQAGPAITSFNFTTPVATGVIDEDIKTITIIVPYATDVTALVPTIVFAGASVSPASDISQDFTDPVTYTVTAASGLTQAYVVTVTVAPAPTLSSIAITTPATKLSYFVGEPLDITGLVVTGTYSDASTKVETITTANITGFDSSIPADDQILTITVGEKTTTYTVDIVAVPDTTPPVITLNGPATINLYIGEDYADAGATALDDIDGDITDSIVTGGDTVDTGTAGTYTITYNVSDAAGNPAEQVTRTVIVSAVPDTEAPVLAEVTPVPALTNDNTPDYTFSSTEAGTINYEGSCSSLTTEAVAGDNTITFNTLDDDPYNDCVITVTDSAGNESDPLNVSAFTIDATPPEINLNGDETMNLTVGDDYNEPGATATDDMEGDLTDSIITGGDAVDTSTADTYVVTYNVSDSAGNAATQVIRTVIVSEAPDETSPVITLLGDNPVTLEVDTAYTDAGATASDNVDGDISDSITTGGDTVDVNTIGTYTITYNVSDSAGNPATEVTRIVNVVDTTTPVITVLGDNPVTHEVGTTYTDAGATASDNYDGSITANIVTVNSVDSNTPGTYTVTYNITDSSGNTADEVTRTVNVVDTTAPVITLLGENPINIPVNTAYEDAGATALDNYEGDLTIITPRNWTAC